MSRLIKRTISPLLAIVLLPALLAACVSTTTGPFTKEASPEKALDRRVGLARQYIGEGDWENAKRNLKLAQQIDDSNAEVHEAFGLVYQSTGEYELAEEHFKKSISLDRKCSRCRNNYAAFLYNQERYRDAEQQLEVVVTDSLYSARPNAFVNLGLCRLKLFDPQGAEEAFVRTLSMDRTNRIALLELAAIRFETDDMNGARNYYNTYRQLVRQQSARGLWLGIRMARESGDRDAEASYALALSNLYPTSAEFQAYQRTLQEGG